MRSCTVTYVVPDRGASNIVTLFGHYLDEVGPDTEFCPEEPDTTVLAALRAGACVDAFQTGIVGTPTAAEVIDSWLEDRELPSMPLAEDLREIVYVDAAADVHQRGDRSMKATLVGPFKSFLQADDWCEQFEALIRDADLEGWCAYRILVRADLSDQAYAKLMESL